MIKQAMDYDSDGVFVRQWVTELKAVPGSRVHMPWTLAAADLQRCGLELGIDYPRPVIMAPEWSRHSAGGPRSAGPKVSSSSQLLAFLSLQRSHLTMVTLKIFKQGYKGSII